MSLVELFREQAGNCAPGVNRGPAGSPLMVALLEGAADDLDRGGVVATLMAGADERPGSVPALRFAGSLHRLVLERRAPELALHYPSVGGTAPPAELWPAAERTVRAHLDRLRELITHPVQTNEVGRAAVLLGGLLHVAAYDGLPVRLLEVGASGGLNLRVDAAAYAVGDRMLGDPASPLRLEQPWVSDPAGWPPVDAPLAIAERRGCDPDPVDPTTSDGRLTLTSYVWADQRERLARLRAAFELARRVPVTVDRASAGPWLERQLAAPALGHSTVVWHSVVRQYVPRPDRDRARAALEAAGERASEDAPLVQLSMEPERRDGAWVFEVWLRRWPDGSRRRLGTCLGHGPPISWDGSAGPGPG